ncbi:QcrA and Rieske domain-containing protein [Thalassiella azotivora]
MSDRLDDLCPSRRGLLQALAGAVLLPGVLVACGGGAGDGDESADGAATGTLAAADVPVGQAVVVSVSGVPVVVAQPTEGEFVAFSAACTHQGTTVTVREGTDLVCPNHGSRFDGSDGAVLAGPATSPLRSLPVAQDGDVLRVG